MLWTIVKLVGVALVALLAYVVYDVKQKAAFSLPPLTVSDCTKHGVSCAAVNNSRLIAWAEYGTPTGEPTLFLHGFPGSHMQAKYYDSTFKELNMRVIAPSIAPWGISDDYENRQVVDLAYDLQQLLQHLQITSAITVIGVSGGTPYAMALAAVLPHMVKRLALLGPLLPYAVLQQEQIFAKWSIPQVVTMRGLQYAPALTNFLFGLAEIKLQQEPEKGYSMVMANMPLPKEEKAALETPEFQQVLADSFKYAWIRMPYPFSLFANAWKPLTREWGFDLHAVKQVPHIFMATARDDHVHMVAFVDYLHVLWPQARVVVEQGGDFHIVVHGGALVKQMMKQAK